LKGKSETNSLAQDGSEVSEAIVIFTQAKFQQLLVDFIVVDDQVRPFTPQRHYH
jgi:hypothetical protein